MLPKLETFTLKMNFLKKLLNFGGCVFEAPVGFFYSKKASRLMDKLWSVVGCDKNRSCLGKSIVRLSKSIFSSAKNKYSWVDGV